MEAKPQRGGSAEEKHSSQVHSLPVSKLLHAWLPAHACTQMPRHCTLLCTQTYQRGSTAERGPRAAKTEGSLRKREPRGGEVPHPRWRRAAPCLPRPRKGHKGTRICQGSEPGQQETAHTHTHTRQANTHVSVPACTHGRRPTSWAAHHGNRVAPSQLQSSPEGF